jgi:flavorubredoxin
MSGEARVEIRLTEIASGVHQLTTYLPEMDFSLNQFVVDADEPLLFHTGMRSMFPSVSATVSRVLPRDRVRWIAFGHIEADECGSMNEWLTAAPKSTVVQSTTGCMVSIGDLADREPRPLADGEVLDIGGHALRWIDTPHVPHAWEAGLLYDETTRTLFSGDLFTQMGQYAPSTTGDIVGPAVAAEDSFPGSSSLHPASGATIRRLASLEVDTLAPMHGPAFTGDCRQALLDLADDFDKRIAGVA